VVDGLILELIIWHFRCLRDGIAGQGFRPPREPWVRKIPLHPAQAEEKHQGLGFLTKRSGSRAIKKKKKISYPFIPLISFVLSGRAVHFVSCWYSSAVGIKSFLMDYLFVIFNWNR
jgi:hypothetical protein